jgi:hypothetical protein
MGRQPRATGGRRRNPAGHPGYGYRSRRAAEVPAALLQDPTRRRAAEFLVPSSVILAGVLAVVAVAVTVNWGMRRGAEPAALPAPPPAFGSQPLAPEGQWYFPTPSTGVSPTVTPAPTASPSPPADRARPPSRSRVSTPTDAVALSRAAVPAFVDLTTEGTRDWVHWGMDSTFSLERRSNGGFAILEGAPTAPRHRHALSPQRFVWRDGNPVGQTTGTPSGIRTCGATNGFTLSSPAGRDSRTLRLYLGVLKGHGRLEAKLTTGGTAVSAELDSRSTLTTAVFTATYQATGNGTLTITWVTTQSYDSSCGGVTLQAATLR